MQEEYKRQEKIVTVLIKGGYIFSSKPNLDKIALLRIIYPEESKYKEYVGYAQSFLPNGQGKITLKNGDIEEGKFKDGRLVEGTKIFQNGDIEKGEFKDGWLVEGKVVFKNGNVYKGEFNKDGRLVEGTKIFQNGDVYKGKFNKDSCLVEGKVVSKADDVTMEGIFVDAELFSGVATFRLNGLDKLLKKENLYFVKGKEVSKKIYNEYLEIKQRALSGGTTINIANLQSTEETKEEEKSDKKPFNKTKAITKQQNPNDTNPNDTCIIGLLDGNDLRMPLAADSDHKPKQEEKILEARKKPSFFGNLFGAK